MARAKLIPPIERRVQFLCDVLNALPGVTTFSSCGGHKHPKIVSQCKESEFFVAFDIEPLRVGWKSLGIITWASHQTSAGQVDVSAWLSGDEPDTLSFEIKGKRWADPDEIAAAICEYVSFTKE